MIRLLQLQISARFDSPIDPRFPEAMVRGALGYTLKNLVCIRKNLKDCSACLINRQCIYSLMYDNSGKTYNGLQVSPYVLRCSQDTDDPTLFYIRFFLFQPLIPFAGHLIFALREAGEKGIGRERHPFTIQGIGAGQDGDFQSIERALESLESRTMVYKPDYVQDESQVTCSLDFLTPTRIKRDNRMKDSVSFHDIVKSCIMRYRNLERAFSQNPDILSKEIRVMLAETGDVLFQSSVIHWEQKERFSSRQKNRVSAGGFTGSLSFRGPVLKFKEFLEFGSLAGIGKNTAFGCGHFKVELSE